MFNQLLDSEGALICKTAVVHNVRLFSLVLLFLFCMCVK